MRYLFILTIAALILLAGVQLGMRAGYRLAEARQNEQAYIDRYLAEHWGER